MMPLLGVSPMLLTRDMARAIEFYTEVLGFRLEGRWPETNPCWCSLRHGRANIMFTTNGADGDGCPKLTGCLYVYTADLMDLYEQVKDKVKVTEEPAVRFYRMKEFSIEDCHGYTLIFGQDTDERPAGGSMLSDLESER